jgi:hypothetical protein
MKLIYYSYLGIVFLIVILNLNANLTFGKGLGDIVYLSILVILTIVYSIFFFVQTKADKFKDKLSVYVFSTLLLLTILITTLYLTFLRGAEYSWNGDIFLH